MIGLGRLYAIPLGKCVIGNMAKSLDIPTWILPVFNVDLRRTDDVQLVLEIIEMSKSLKTERIEARVEPEIRNLIHEAAELEGCSVSEFLVASAKDRAEKAMHRRTVIRLTQESQVRFAEMILDPPPPNDAMKEAIEEYDRMIDSV